MAEASGSRGINANLSSQWLFTGWEDMGSARFVRYYKGNDIEQ